MERPRIGVVEQGTWKTRLYASCVESAGGEPHVLPWTGDPRSDATAWDALVLCGGDDPDARHFGEANHPAVVRVPEVRDLYEIALLRAAVEAGTPLLAVCRGAQMLNVALGGALEQHLPDVPGRTEHRDGTLHAIRVVPGTRLDRLLGGSGGARPVVNSFHHQGIGRLASLLTASARAEDGTVEAVEGPGPFCLGVQWHPEREGNDPPLGRELFEALLEAARSARAAGAPGIRGRGPLPPPSKAAPDALRDPAGPPLAAPPGAGGATRACDPS